MDNQEIYKKALETYGAENQTRMVFEEMAELQKELCKHARGAENSSSIAEEIADVQIMLEQMIFFYDLQKTVNFYKSVKIKRLAERIKHDKADDTGTAAGT